MKVEMNANIKVSLLKKIWGGRNGVYGVDSKDAVVWDRPVGFPPVVQDQIVVEFVKRGPVLLRRSHL